MTHETVKILWTGGWDSTFMLLKLVLIDKQKVEPLYLIDPERKSIRHEFLAMRNIKKELFSLFPESKQLLLPTKYYNIHDFEIDPEIKKAHNTYRKKHKLGRQYAWLASFCKSQNLSNIKIGIEKGCLFESFFNGKKHEENFKIIFKYFKFPLINISKHGMLNEAQNNEWMSILLHTWFCHKPTRKGNPCGKCNPCRSVIKKGMSWRIPKIRLLLRYLS